MEFFEQIKNKNNLTVLLFIILFINFLPLGIPNFISNSMLDKASVPAETGLTIISFAITVFLLGYFFYKRVDVNKEIKVNLLMLIIFCSILLIVQIVNIICGDFYYKDLLNVICKFLNILLFFVLFLNLKVDEKYMVNFMKWIVYLGFFACVFNFIFFYQEMFDIIKGIEDIKIKSFFANRNQLAFFMFISIISNIFVITKSQNKFYKFSLFLFIFNLLITFSRTGILVTGIFAFLFFVTTDKFSLKKKVICMLYLVLACVAFIILLSLFNQSLIENAYKLFFRPDSIKNLSGRSDIWNIAGNVLEDSFGGIIWGVGRFKGTKDIVVRESVFTQFHNGYIEALISGGIIELAYIIYLYLVIIKKIFKSNMKNIYKRLYLSSIISFLIYMFFESYSRFSIGYVDTLCLIFFITIPLLHVNSCDTNKIEGEK